jgi:cell division protein FtsW
MISRADRSRFAEWWFTVDRQLLALIGVLMVSGLLLSLAASPAIAIKRGFATYHFVYRQFFFAALATVVIIAVSFASPLMIRRLAIISLCVSLVGLVAVLMVGHDINGAKRWLPILGQTLQPSEFAKPGFIVVTAWLFAETKRRPDMPALALAAGLAALLTSLLIAEPDIGQALLVGMVWSVLYIISGQPRIGALVLLLGAPLAGMAAYFSFSHVRARVDRYLSGVSGDHSQVDRALQAIMEGGFLGRGPGEGTVKIVLPDAHTDFILAVVAEEYGVLACLMLLALFAAITLKAVIRAGREGDPANRLAILGLAMVFALQALINMGVNVGLLPAKGMTLPFISAGGSSTLAVALTLGMLLALTRKRTDLANLKKPRLVATELISTPPRSDGARDKWS